MSMKAFEVGDIMILVGTRIKTTKAASSDWDYGSRVVTNRRWGQFGVISSWENNGHGSYYVVSHGHEKAVYEEQELEIAKNNVEMDPEVRRMIENSGFDLLDVENIDKSALIVLLSEKLAKAWKENSNLNSELGQGAMDGPLIRMFRD